MTIEKAIELLTDADHYNTILPTLDEKDALRLGIEALKREQLLRREVPYDRDGLLPGETKE